jgi:hypothetical protein
MKIKQSKIEKAIIFINEIKIKMKGFEENPTSMIELESMSKAMPFNEIQPPL